MGPVAGMVSEVILTTGRMLNSGFVIFFQEMEVMENPRLKYKLM